MKMEKRGAMRGTSEDRRIGWRAGGLLLVTLLAVTAPAQALKAELRPLAARIDSLEQLGRQAIREGRGAEALDLMQQMYQEGLAFVGFDFLPLASSLMVQRYFEVFEPPANADSLARPSPEFRWPEEPPPTYGGFHGSTDTTSCLGPWKDRDDPCLVLQDDRTKHTVIDFDLDGRPEFTCTATDMWADPTLTVVVDRAPDGRRYQWLVSRHGHDPRHQPSIWYFVDGGAYWLVVDIEEDGKGDLGLGGFFPVAPK